jgi:aldose 1-epimerase
MVRGEASSPYRYDGFQSFRLIGRCLEIGLHVINRGEVPLPFGLGWHPYFPLTAGTTLMAPATGFWSEGGDHLPDRQYPVPPDLDFGTSLPIPRRWVNNVFDGWIGVAEIRWPEWGCRLTITADPPLSHYMVFAPGRHRGSEPGDDYFCFEPMSHRPGGHHSADLSGLVPLVPGRALKARIRLEADGPAFWH